MRNAFGRWLAEFADENPKCLLLSGDIGFGVFDDFRVRHDSKFINCGIAEQNMIGVAAGLSAEGYIVFVYTIIPFLLYRPYEFVRNLIASQNLPVILVGVGGGFSYDTLGYTHYGIEDLTLTKTLPNISIYTPYDPITVVECAAAATKRSSPTYIRLMKGGEPTVPALQVGRVGDVVFDGGQDCTVLVHGSIVAEVLLACNALLASGHAKVRVIAIKSNEQLGKFIDSVPGRRVFIEEHIYPGLFGEYCRPSDLHLAIKNEPPRYVANRISLLKAHYLDAESIKERISRALDNELESGR